MSLIKPSCENSGLDEHHNNYIIIHTAFFCKTKTGLRVEEQVLPQNIKPYVRKGYTKE